MTFTPLAPAPANRSPGDTSITGDNNANAAAIGNVNDYLSGDEASPRTVVTPADDLATIQSLVDAGPVWFADGTYTMGTLNLSTGADIAGTSKAVLRRPNADPAASQRLFVVDGAQNVRVSGITLDGNRANQTVVGSMLRVVGSGHLFERVRFRDHLGYGISLNAGTTRTTVRNCIGHGGSRASIVLNGTALDPVTHTLIEGCHLWSSDEHGIHNIGIAAWVTYANNVISDTGLDGISCYNAANAHTLITGNTIRNAGNHFVHTGGNHVEISDNIGLTAATHGWFHRNHDGSATTDYVIADNIAEGVTSRSIHVDSAHDGVISGNVVRGGGTHAVELVLCNRVSFTGNVVHASANDGVNLMGCTRIACSGNTVHSNTRHGIIIRQEPATLTESSDIVVSGNNVHDNGNTGVLSQNGSDRGCVTGNIVRGNTTAQISLVGVNNVQANNITA